MSELMVCGKWPLILTEGKGGHFAYLDTASSKNVACFLELVKDLPQGMSVVEHFGGVGIFSTIIEQLLHPSMHTMFDKDPDCVRQLQSAFPPLVGPTYSIERAMQGDAHYSMANVPAELVVCDFAYATIKHHDEWPWGTMFAHKPRYVIWSDTALRRLGLHRGLYSSIFKRSIITHRDYVQAYSMLLCERYEYRVTRVAHHVYSYLLAEPVKQHEYTMGFDAPIEIVKAA